MAPSAASASGSDDEGFGAVFEVRRQHSLIASTLGKRPIAHTTCARPHRNQKVSARRRRRRQFVPMSGEHSVRSTTVRSSETLESKSDSSRDIHYGVRFDTLALCTLGN